MRMERKRNPGDLPGKSEGKRKEGEYFFVYVSDGCWKWSQNQKETGWNIVVSVWQGSRWQVRARPSNATSHKLIFIAVYAYLPHMLLLFVCLNIKTSAVQSRFFNRPALWNVFWRFRCWTKWASSDSWWIMGGLWAPLRPPRSLGDGRVAMQTATRKRGNKGGIKNRNVWGKELGWVYVWAGRGGNRKWSWQVPGRNASMLGSGSQSRS